MERFAHTPIIAANARTALALKNAATPSSYKHLQSKLLQKQDDKHEVVAHLNMVRLNLKRDKQSSHNPSQQIFLPISQYNTGNRRRNISQCDKFPDMPCRYQNKEIGGESPDNPPKADNQTDNPNARKGYKTRAS